MEDIKGVLYNIPCECGTKCVAETGHTHGIRVAEHQQAVKDKSMNNEIAFHVMVTNHQIQWEQAEFPMTVPHWIWRKVKEALFIKKTIATVIVDKGF